MGCQCTKHNDSESDTAILSYDDVYDGEKNCFGQKHGYGEFLYANGDVYRGCWKYNKMHGAGVYTPLLGEKRDGFFRNGVFIGKHWDKPTVFVEEKLVQSPPPPQTVWDKQLEAERAQRKFEREQRRMKSEQDRAERRKRREEFHRKYPKRTHVKNMARYKDS